MTHQDLDLTADIIDVRDIIARIEELEAEYQPISDSDDDAAREAWDNTEEGKELSMLLELMEEMKGYGGDEQWRGDWYPVTLIRETYFTDYIKELIHDCYEMPKGMHGGDWPYRHMTFDYEAAADEAKVDYTTVEIDGVDYFFR